MPGHCCIVIVFDAFLVINMSQVSTTTAMTTTPPVTVVSSGISSISSVTVSNIHLYSVLHMLGCQAINLPSTKQIVPQLSVWY